LVFFENTGEKRHTTNTRAMIQMAADFLQKSERQKIMK
jgi:hypothetical protein